MNSFRPGQQDLLQRAGAGDDVRQVPVAIQSQEKIEIARSLANDALTGIRALHADNTVNDAVITATSLSHQTSINLYSDGTDKIEAVDRNEVAAKIDLAQTQLQAIFAVMGTTNQISLVNFLA